MSIGYTRAYVRSEHRDNWYRIGRVDRAGRRSLWARLVTIEGPPSNGYDYEGDDILAIEMCSGREGDDSFAYVAAHEACFSGVLDVITCAIGNIDDDQVDRSRYDDENEPL